MLVVVVISLDKCRAIDGPVVLRFKHALVCSPSGAGGTGATCGVGSSLGTARLAEAVSLALPKASFASSIGAPQGGGSSAWGGGGGDERISTINSIVV